MLVIVEDKITQFSTIPMQVQQRNQEGFDL